jgi:hypothetical protein
MAAFNKFQGFVEHLAEKVHNLETDSLKIALSNTAPNAALTTVNTILASITQITAANGYVAGGNAVGAVTSAQTTGTYKLTATGDVTFTAAGGSIGPFQYAVLYNDTPSAPAKPLIGWWDYGTGLTVTSGNTFTVDLDQTNGILTIT